MSLYKQEYNPLSKSFNLVPTNTAIRVRDTVASQANLPLTGNTIGDGRVTTDTGHLYIWSIEASSGLLTDWIDQGNFVDVDWAAITNKPSSSVANIDDAVSKKHTQGTDQGLDTGGPNAVTAAQAKAGYTHSGVITGNPHQVNKSDVGLGNVDNKSEDTIITDVKADTDVADAISKKHSHVNSAALDLVSGTNTGDQVVPTTLAALSDDSTHRLVTDTEKSTWNGKQDALGFTPEDVANKDTTTTLGTSDTKYPSQKAVKTYVDALGVTTNTIRDLSLNIMLNAFRIAQQGSLALLKMVDQFVDEYEDETGVDTVNSTNESYDSTDDFYTPSTDSYTKLLLHLDNNVTDVVGKTVTNNNVTFSDTVKKFGTYSAVFNGSTAYLTVPDSDDWNFGSGDFTIDFWFRPSSVSGNKYIYEQRTDAGNDITFYQNGTNIIFDVLSGSSQIALYTFPTALEIDTWYHIALVRDGSNIYLFKNGESITPTIGQAIGASSMPDLTSDLYIGRAVASAANYVAGYLDEFRISKGIARWTSGFTPETNPYSIRLNMTLISNAQTANSAPTSGRLVLFEEDVDSITLNTDLIGYISRDNGATWTAVTLEDCGNYVSGAQILQGVVDISAQPSGTNMKYKVETLNNKNLKLHGAAISWK